MHPFLYAGRGWAALLGPRSLPLDGGPPGGRGLRVRGLHHSPTVRHDQRLLCAETVEVGAVVAAILFLSLFHLMK
jgi:hypothetical protein